jgi:D-alanyl-D-alanine carboxypeptidase/D-alanyl-D-alanine-endopeptidase (penicillin-binding protein 4)
MHRRIALTVLLVVLTVAFGFGQSSTLADRLESFRTARSLKHAQWSVYASYVDEGNPLIALNSERSLAPASCLKLITTAVGIEVLGEDYRFQTLLYHDGSVDRNGVLHGNIYIVGGGDPTLGSDLTPGSLGLDSLMPCWVSAIRAEGVRRVNGSILSDDFAFDRVPIPDDWFWIDIGNYYATSTSALSIHDNLYRIFFKPGKRVGDAAKVLRMEPEIPGLSFVNYMKTGREGSGDNGYIYCAPDQWKAVLRGTIPAGVDEFDIKGSIPDPPLFAAQTLSACLSRSGVSVAGSPALLETKHSYEHASLITTTFSPPLKDIITVINKRSFNLYAEQLLKAIGLRKLGEGSTEKGIEAVSGELERLQVNTEGLQLNDGCGLARTNGITTRTIVDLLTAMTRSRHFDAYYGSISVAGDSSDIGYFKEFGVGTELQYNARVKSGSIQGVRSYSGYVHDRSGRLIAFSLIANNYARRASEVDAIHKEIILELAKLP